MSEGIAILLVAQLNRSAEGKEDLTLAALKNSGSLEEDGDVVIMLSRNEKGTDLNLAKNRNGQTGPIAMRFDGSRYTFTEKATKSNCIYIGDENEKDNIQKTIQKEASRV